MSKTRSAAAAAAAGEEVEVVESVAMQADISWPRCDCDLYAWRATFGPLYLSWTLNWTNRSCDKSSRSGRVGSLHFGLVGVQWNLFKLLRREANQCWSHDLALVVDKAKTADLCETCTGCRQRQWGKRLACVRFAVQPVTRRIACLENAYFPQN